MVGTRTSTGCATCLKRKKKCDEKRPSCSACSAGGWKCPGYQTRWKFVNEDARLKLQYRKKPYIFESDELSSSSDILGNDSPSPGAASTFEWRIRAPILSRQDLDAACFVGFITNRSAHRMVPFTSLGNFLDAIPQRLGRNDALDETISCLCMVSLDQADIPDYGGATIRQYAKSIAALRACIDDPEVSKQSETLCASIMLQFCELMINRDHGRWNFLLRGTERLIEHRGSANHVTAFDRAMLESQRAFILAQALGSSRNCFLSEPRWRELVAQPSPEAWIPTSFALRSQLCDHLVDILDLKRDLTRFRRLTSAGVLVGSDVSVETQLLHQKAAAVRLRFESWYYGEFEPLLMTVYAEIDMQHAYPDSILSQDFDVLLIILDCVSQAVLVKLNAASPRVSPHEEISPSNRPRLSFEAGRARARNAFTLVKNLSGVAAKPLGIAMKNVLNDASWEDANIGYL